MSSRPPEPMRIDSVTMHPDYPQVIRVRDIQGAELFYLQQPLTGQLIPGRVYLAWHAPYEVALFWPLGAWDPPLVLKVTDRD